MGYSHGHKWTYEDAFNKVKKCIDVMGYSSMPTTKELKDFYGESGLAVKLNKRIDWKEKIMRDLEIKYKDCETTKGKKYECLASEILIKNGFRVERMTTKEHFDLLVDGVVKVDVKVGKRWYIEASQANSFGIHKKYATCDVYMLIALNDNCQNERIFIIPSFLARNQSTLTIGKNSKYDKWINRYDIINNYSSFLNSAN